MSEQKDLYKILGINSAANEDEIKKAYRNLAFKHHPDRNPDDSEAEETFKEINMAYQILSDPEKKGIYDAYGLDGLRGRYSSEDFGFSPFDDLSSIFEGIFGNFFGMGPGRKRRRRGSDIQTEVEISLEEVALGTTREIEINISDFCSDCNGNGVAKGKSPQKCPKCRGAGQIRITQGFFSLSHSCPYCEGSDEIITDPCKTCRGTGRIRNRKSIKITIPKGISSGMRLRIYGEGDIGSRGGERGDLYILVKVKKHEFFSRDGEDLLCEVPITFVEAALGIEIDIPTLISENAQLRIPPGTQSGSVFKFKKKGLPGGYGTGDQYIKIFVETPTKLNNTQKELLKQFAEISGEKVHPRKNSFLERLKGILGRKG